MTDLQDFSRRLLAAADHRGPTARCGRTFGPYSSHGRTLTDRALFSLAELATVMNRVRGMGSLGSGMRNVKRAWSTRGIDAALCDTIVTEPEKPDGPRGGTVQQNT